LRFYGSGVATVQVQGWKTTILPLPPALVAPSPAFWRPSDAGSAAADIQALNLLTHHFTGAELQALFCQVKDLLEADEQQPDPMHTRELHIAFPTSQLVHQSSVTSGLKECLATLAEGDFTHFSAGCAQHATA
jgi:hypothetical protein